MAMPHVHLVLMLYDSPLLSSTVWPGEYLEVDSPTDLDPNQDHTLALEPCVASATTSWPSPCIVSTIAGKIRLPNTMTTNLLLI